MLRNLGLALLLLTVPAVSLCETSPPEGSPAPAIQNHETPGNLAATQDRGCIALQQADGSMSPADLALSVRKCIAEDNQQDAVQLFVLMLARARFDTERVADRTAHQASIVLPTTIVQSLQPAQRARFIAEYNSLTENLKGPEFGRLCHDIRALGIPRHDPSYMIAHGMKAVLGKTDNPLVQGFDAEKAWARVFEYLKCPS